MDAYGLFRQLGAGARFDVKRFSQDARRFKVIKVRDSEFDTPESLDFFGSKDTKHPNISENGLGTNGSKKSKVKIQPLESHMDEKADDSEERLNAGTARKRKQDTGNFEGKKRKRKTQEPISVILLWKMMGYVDVLFETKIKDTRKSRKKPTAEKLETTETAKVMLQTIAQEMLCYFLSVFEANILLKVLTHSINFCFVREFHFTSVEFVYVTHEVVKLSEGLSRIHMIHKATESNQKFGPNHLNYFAFSVDILVTTPNRLIYLLKQDPPVIDLTRVEWLVVDESDKLFEDGKSGFRDQLASIFLACTSHVVKRALFSATFAFDVEQWCKLNLDNIILVSVGARNAAAETVDQELLFVGSETGKLLAMRDLVKKGFTPPVLVFVQSIERAKELFHELIYEGINVDVIHADKTQQQRDNVVHSFRAGKIWVLICTALLARGIDFKGVNMVINYDFPTSAVEYIHRIGRTGRAGHTGKAVTFFTEDDKPLLRSVANVIQQAGCPVPDYIKAFHKLQSKQKKKLIKKPLEREHIRTTPQYLLEKAKKKKKIIQKNIKEKKPKEANK
nr:probable ATP-dependent RNA helicase DDX52 [Chelonoidis abingdonii]